MKRSILLTILWSLTLNVQAPTHARAEHLEVQGRLDLAPILRLADGSQGPSRFMRIRALAHDGTNLWILAPEGDEILCVETHQGSLVDRVPLPPKLAVRHPAGLAFGNDSLWLVDAARRRLLRIGLDGQVRSITDLGMLPLRPVAVDFLPGGSQGSDLVIVAFRGREGRPEWQQQFEVYGNQLVPGKVERLLVGRSWGRATAIIEGFPYTWVIAERGDEGLIQGDAPDDGDASQVEDVLVPPPDDTIPRGGEDAASSHLLALTSPEIKRILFEVHPTGPAPRDLAAAGATLYYPEGRGVIQIARLVDSFQLEYGACVWRDLEFHHNRTLDEVTNPDFNYVYPYEGRVPLDTWQDNAAGYLDHQDIIEFLEEAPLSSFYTLGIPDGIDRQGRTFLAGDELVSAGSVETFYRVRAELCSARFNILSHRVGNLDDIPLEILERYTYDGDGDGFGDDNPWTESDDFFMLDSDVVHEHLLAALSEEPPPCLILAASAAPRSSAAADEVNLFEKAEVNLYEKARRIHDYVKRRHVYSSGGTGWRDPEFKLQSPYSSCSPSAFMVVALAREAGIPARLVGTTKQRKTADGSYDLRTVLDVARDIYFHRWAQIYLPPYGWVRVDATPAGPEQVGYNDVNCDREFDQFDRCTDPTLCGTCPVLDPPVGPGPHPPICPCSLPGVFRNPNDANGDGVVDGRDVELLGACYFTEQRLRGGFASGVGTRDLITIVAAGQPDPLLGLHYITKLTTNGEFARRCRGRELECYVDWSNPKGIPSVRLDSSVPRAGKPDRPHESIVSWQITGPFDQSDLVRIDAYRLIGDKKRPRYRFIQNLARDVPAFTASHPVDLSDLKPGGGYVVVVSRQGGPWRDRLSAQPQADWETFGASQAFRISRSP